MLAYSAAEAGANKTAYLAVAVFKLDLVCFAALDDGVALCAVNADVSDLVINIVFMSALSGLRVNAHTAEIGQKERGVVPAADENLVLFRRRFEPCDHPVSRKRFAVERYEMRPCNAEPTVHVRVDQRDHTLIIGEPDPEIIIDLSHATELPFEFSFNINQVAAFQVKHIVVIRILPPSFGEKHLYHGLARFSLRFPCGGHNFIRLFRRSLRRKTDLKCHSDHRSFFFIHFQTDLSPFRSFCLYYTSLYVP